MVVICCVLNGKDMVLAPKQLQALYTDVRHWEELIDFIDTNGGPQQPYIPTSMFKCISEQDEWDKEYLGLYIHGQIMNDPIYGQISYNCCLANAFKLKLRHNPEIFLVEIKRATGKEIEEDVIGTAKVIPASCVKVRCAQLLNIMHRPWKVLKRVEEKRGWRMVGKRMILVLM